MHFDLYTRRDLAESAWRLVASFARAVRIRFPPKSRYITIVIELDEEHTSDDIRLVEVKGWQLYEEHKNVPPST